MPVAIVTVLTKLAAVRMLGANGAETTADRRELEGRSRLRSGGEVPPAQA